MVMLTIRNIEPAIKERLRVRAAQNARSMEAEARDILRQALAPQGATPGRSLYERIRARFEPLGGADLDVAPREATRPPPRFE